MEEDEAAVGSAKDSLIRRRVLLGTASNYAAKFFSLGLIFFLTPFIIHRLGAAEYGLWVLVNSVIGYGTLLDLGLADALIKYVAEFRARQESSEASGLVATTLWLYVGIGLVAVVLSIGLTFLFPYLFDIAPDRRPRAMLLMLLMGLNLAIAIPCTTTTAVLRGLHRFDLDNILGIAGSLINALATVTVLLLGGGVIGLAIISLVITPLMQVPRVWLIRRAAPDLHLGWSGAKRRYVRTVTSFSWSLFVLHLSGRVQSKTDEIVIGAFLTLRIVAPYSIARSLSEVPQILSTQLVKVLTPLASELDGENDQGRLRSVYLTGTRLTLVLFVPLAGPLIVLAGPILNAWVGPEFMPYAPIVAILTIAGLIETSQWPAMAVLQGMARHRPISLIWIGTAVANLGLSIALLHVLGATGVALGTLVPTTIACLGLILPFTARVLGVTLVDLIKEIAGPSLLPAIPMLLILFVLRQVFAPSSLVMLALVGAVGLLVYTVVYLMFGASDFERNAYRTFQTNVLRSARARLTSS